MAGQTLLIAGYCFLFAPMFFNGIGPEEKYDNSGATAGIAAAMIFGALAVVTNIWSCRGIACAIKNQGSAVGRLVGSSAIQALVVIFALRFGWLTAIVASVAVLLSLLLCIGLDRRAFGKQ
ncbi:hypothetical protein [Streptomyces sp. ISL-11]|uniref:hypothetical protein n=1 Tax=Streptomyces sp. ISL-11 TaxID=2819174 RepID=UPI001BE6BC64|nr:hypothetical protein [Streptomyces sp. ISL-11]MBT2384207.1 hypothetical protein [Streptomyces sp. ISL-11]